MSLEHLTPLQGKLLEMLSWYHDFCTAHGLRYYAVGGTMLGAMRHQGFIPWDDDIDVGMPRSDYMRLRTLMAEEGTQGRYVLEMLGDKGHTYLSAKLYDTTTTLAERRRNQPVRGVFMDIFPLDGIGDGPDDSLRAFRPIALRLNLLTARMCQLRKGRSWLKNASILLAQLLPRCLYNEENAMQAIDAMCASRSFDDYAYVGNLVGAWRNRELMQRAWFGTPVEYSFENIAILGVSQPDEYLSNLYGDWRQLPKNQRQTTHNFLKLDLNTPYQK